MPDFEVVPPLLNSRAAASLEASVNTVLAKGTMITGTREGEWVKTGNAYQMAKYLRELTKSRAETIGVISRSAPAGGGDVQAVISFPANRFQGPATVMATTVGAESAAVVSASVDQVSRSGFVLRMHRPSDGTMRVAWHAVEGGS